MISSSQPRKCLFSDIPVPDFIKIPSEQGGFYVGYYLTHNGKECSICIHETLTNGNQFIASNKHVFKGLILNGHWPRASSQIINSEDDLKRILAEALFPRTSKEKLDNLLLYIKQSQTHEGESMHSTSVFSIESEQLYFKNRDEQTFYFKTLQEMGFINIHTQSKERFSLQLTYRGLIHATEIEHAGSLSSNCFIAMSFGSGMMGIRDAIKSACRSCGYDPVLIDEVVIAPDKTINDAMIARMREAKFCIADFTGHRMGVYFESGFMLGMGRFVIYTCHKDDFKDSHFDTNHFPHIRYDDTENLKDQLIERINAWIPKSGDKKEE